MPPGVGMDRDGDDGLNPALVRRGSLVRAPSHPAAPKVRLKDRSAQRGALETAPSPTLNCRSSVSSSPCPDAAAPFTVAVITAVNAKSNRIVFLRVDAASLRRHAWSPVTLRWSVLPRTRTGSRELALAGAGRTDRVTSFFDRVVTRP